MNLMSSDAPSQSRSESCSDEWILALESSCDESAVALFCPGTGELKETVFSQIDQHTVFGGVVPDIASREHVKAFAVLLEKMRSDIDRASIATIAVTQGPGLAACLAIGIGYAKSLALLLNVPLLGINHLRAHAFSPFLPAYQAHPCSPAIADDYLPHLGLIVSGGNSLLIEIDKDRCIQVLCETVDDAAGEALDKGARLLGLPYPGGALIEKLATEGDITRHTFPVFQCDASEPRFSFSGLKTSLRYRIADWQPEQILQERPHLCAAYQNAVVRQLSVTVERAMQDRQYRSLGLSGGVANNKVLRSALADIADAHGCMYLPAQSQHTGDNAAMIAFAALADPNVNKAAGLDMPFLPSATIR